MPRHNARRDSIIAVPRFVAAEAWVRFPVSAIFSSSRNIFLSVSVPSGNKLERDQTNFLLRNAQHRQIPKKKITMIGVGFEPTPPKRPVPETGALDRSAIQPVGLAAPLGVLTLACLLAVFCFSCGVQSFAVDDDVLSSVALGQVSL